MTYFHLFDFFRNHLLYGNRHFLNIDYALKRRYLWQNPFKISKRFLQAKGETDLYTYGETPLKALDKIFTRCQVLSKDIVYDLGCGSGRTTFWIHSFIKAKVHGIDWNPYFIQNAQVVSKQCRLNNIQFSCENFLEAKFDDATVVYLFGTCLDDATIKQLADHFKQFKRGTKVITVSYSIADFAEENQFIEKDVFTIRFPWGKTEVYLCLKL